MSLSKEEVEHIAALARLNLSADEIERFQQQLSDILDHVSSLQELNTQDVAATSGILDKGSRLREDIAGDSMSREDLLSNAPNVKDNQFRVPPVLD
jgi:aspartyl-tRNA(Asn)/glutamyl-tRNA(Gln) amidotransferase subunit C